MKVGEVFCIPHLTKAIFFGYTEHRQAVFFAEDGLFYLVEINTLPERVLDYDPKTEKRLKKTKRFLKYLFFR
uniref:Uncharacterized protein n=1 Tax=Marseillevirus sp. TaxID=2809551 RepID=A0AA96EPA9_9VIRU|nr:hypothetical protein MarDSR_205 [Marseillevirus sp.]